MNHQDAYAKWLEQCREADVRADFTLRTMQVIRASLERQGHKRQASWLSALLLAAGILLVAIGHAGTVGLLICSMTGVAQ